MPYVMQSRFFDGYPVYEPPIPIGDQSAKMHSEFLGIFRSGGEKISADVVQLLPKRCFYHTDEGQVPEMITAGAAGYTFSREFRALVEEMEPGVHEFFPHEVHTVGAIPIPVHERYFISIKTLRNILDLDRCYLKKGWINIRSENRRIENVRNPISGGGGVVFRPEAIEGHHLWRIGDVEMAGRIVVSDTLHERIMIKGLIGLKFDICEYLPREAG